jgi:hypothetical protein
MRYASTFFTMALLATAPLPLLAKSTMELAVAEAQKYDLNGNGRIEGGEVSGLRGAFAAKPDGWLYMFNDNGDKVLDDAEIAKIRLPESKPKPATSALPSSAKEPPLKDRAIGEAKKFDKNKNGKIEGPEVSELRAAFAAKPNEPLYFFDENRNRSLDDLEVAKIKVPKPAAPKPPAAKPPAKKK